MKNKMIAAIVSTCAYCMNLGIMSAAYVTTPSLDTITVDVQAEHLLTYGSAASSGGVTLQVDTLSTGGSQVSAISNAKKAGEWSWGYDDGSGSMLVQMQLDANDTLWLGGERVLTSADGVLTGGMIAEGSGYRALTFSSLDNVATGSRSIVFGANSTASGQDAFASGVLAIASGSFSRAHGRHNTASGPYARAYGQRALASEDYSLAWGLDVTASGRYAHASGKNSQASGSYATVNGLDSSVSGAYSTVFGMSNHVSSGYAFASGRHHTISGYNGVAFGSFVEVTGTRSFAAGLKLKVSSADTTVFGRYNADFPNATANPQWNDLLFMIGNGHNESSRDYALFVRRNGEMTLKNRFWNASQPEMVPSDPLASNGNALDVMGHSEMRGNVNVSGDAHLAKDVTIAGTLRVQDVSGNIPMYQP